jgi:alpha-D-ribose 1-methylphosphonate 5-triphosphate diphosphatase
MPYVDCRGLTVLPGLIDVHGDMLEREIEPRPGAHFPIDMAVLELDKRLAAAGITTAYPAISFHETGLNNRTRTPERGREIVHTIHKLHGMLLVDMRVHARFEVTRPHVAELIGAFVDAGLVHVVSLMDHTPGQGQFHDIERYIERAAALGRVSREQITASVYERIRLAQEQSPDTDTVREITTRALSNHVVLASHDDDAEDKIALLAGMGVTISEFPVTLEAARAARERGMHVVMGAPNVLRGGSHSGNLSTLEAIEAGVVDVLASDYYPPALLQAVFAVVRHGLLPLHEAAKLVGQNPAAVLHLLDCGAIAAGAAADLVLVETAQHPRVRATIRHGMPIYWDSAMTPRTHPVMYHPTMPMIATTVVAQAERME